MIAIIIIAILGAIGAFISVENVKLKSRLDNVTGSNLRLASRLIERNNEIKQLKQAQQPRTFVLSYQHRAAANELYRLGLSEHDPRVIVATNPVHLRGHVLEEGDRLVTIAPPADSNPRTLDSWADVWEAWQGVLSRSGLMYADQNYIWTIKL